MESLEDMFFDYLKESGETLANHDFLKWLNYFKGHSTYRTCCNDCYDQILEGYHMHRKRVRRQEKIKERMEKEKAQI